MNIVLTVHVNDARGIIILKHIIIMLTNLHSLMIL